MSDKELKFIYRDDKPQPYPSFWEWVAYIGGVIAIFALMYLSGGR